MPKMTRKKTKRPGRRRRRHRGDGLTARWTGGPIPLVARPPWLLAPADHRYASDEDGDPGEAHGDHLIFPPWSGTNKPAYTQSKYLSATGDGRRYPAAYVGQVGERHACGCGDVDGRGTRRTRLALTWTIEQEHDDADVCRPPRCADVRGNEDAGGRRGRSHAAARDGRPDERRLHGIRVRPWANRDSGCDDGHKGAMPPRVTRTRDGRLA